MIQKVQKTVKVPQVPYSVRDMDVPMIKKQQVLTIQKTAQKSISELDECGTKATEIRQKQYAEFVTLIANSDDAGVDQARGHQFEHIPCTQVAQGRTQG